MRAMLAGKTDGHGIGDKRGGTEKGGHAKWVDAVENQDRS